MEESAKVAESSRRLLPIRCGKCRKNPLAEMAIPRIEIEHDMRSLRIVRKSDNKVLIEVGWHQDVMLEEVADLLSANKFPAQAEQVRELMRRRIA